MIRCRVRDAKLLCLSISTAVESTKNLGLHRKVRHETRAQCTRTSARPYGLRRSTGVFVIRNQTNHFALGNDDCLWHASTSERSIGQPMHAVLRNILVGFCTHSREWSETCSFDLFFLCLPPVSASVFGASPFAFVWHSYCTMQTRAARSAGPDLRHARVSLGVDRVDRLEHTWLSLVGSYARTVKSATYSFHRMAGVKG